MPQDYAEAGKWYRLAAEQGDEIAQWYVGNLYRNGQGVTQDFATAAEWYRKSAMQGYAFAQDFLGDLYSEGRGVAQDYVLAYMWYSLAAANKILVELDKAAAGKRDAIAAKMSPEQIAKAQKLVSEWKPAATPSN